MINYFFLVRFLVFVIVFPHLLSFLLFKWLFHR